MYFFCPIPREQQPINEYQTLKNSFFFCWPCKHIKIYLLYLFITFLFGLFFVFVFNFNIPFFVFDLLLNGLIAGNLLLLLDLIRNYVGWHYIGKRLLSATIFYEESGWYDGQLWVKSNEMLIQDRFIGMYEIKPILNRLKYTLGSATLFLAFLLSIK